MAINDTPTTPLPSWKPSIKYVDMKTRRAKVHLNALESEVSRWVKDRPYSISQKDNLQATWHYFVIELHSVKDDVPLIAGDFINCLRSALDQLAWNLVNLFPETIPVDDKAARQIDFPICRTNAAYADKRKLFPSTVAEILDSFQPDDRANAFRSHPLWQLDKLWNIDKHRTIPLNCGSFGVIMRGGIGGRGIVDYSNDRIVVRVPSLARVCLRPVYVEPRVTPQIMFGEWMGDFELPVSRLREIYNFVCDEVIPKFAGFFS